MNKDDIYIFISTFFISAFGGIASLLRCEESEISKRRLISAFLNSGILGLGIAFLWYSNFKDNIEFLIGVCIIAGLGGNMIIDFVMDAIKKGGFVIAINKGSKDVSGIKLEKENDKDNR